MDDSIFAPVRSWFEDSQWPWPDDSWAYVPAFIAMARTQSNDSKQDLESQQKRALEQSQETSPDDTVAW